MPAPTYGYWLAFLTRRIADETSEVAASRVPNPRPDRFYRLQLLQPTRLSRVHHVEHGIVEAWHTKSENAFRMAWDAVSILANETGNIIPRSYFDPTVTSGEVFHIYDVTPGAPYRFDPDDKSCARWQFTFDATVSTFAR